MEQYKGELYITENILILWKYCLFEEDYHYANMFVPTIYIKHMCIHQESTEQGQKYYRN